jgi:chromosome segregation ATPase
MFPRHHCLFRATLQLSQRLSALTARYDAFVAAQKSDRDSLCAQLQAATNQLTAERATFAQSQREASAAAASALAASNQRCASLQGVVDDSAAELAAHVARIDELSANLQRAQSALAAAEPRYRTLEGAYRKLEDEHARARAFCDESATAIGRLERKIAQQKALIQKLHEQLQAMKAQMEALAMPGARAEWRLERRT